MTRKMNEDSDSAGAEVSSGWSRSWRGCALQAAARGIASRRSISIKPYTLEETYEVLDAIDRRDWDELRAELGDFMLQAVFFAQMASEEKLFDIGDSLDAINEKLIRRHPHVFAR